MAREAERVRAAWQQQWRCGAHLEDPILLLGALAARRVLKKTRVIPKYCDVLGEVLVLDRILSLLLIALFERVGEGEERVALRVG